MISIKKTKKILIVTQDIFLIQTYSGAAGIMVKKIYLFVLGLRLKLLLFFLSRSNIVVLTSDLFIQKSNNPKFKSYSEQMAKIDMGKYRQKSLNLLNNLSRQISRINNFNNNGLVVNIPECLKIWRVHLASRASFYLFPYIEIIKKTIRDEKPDKVIVLGKTRTELIAQKTAAGLKIKFNHFWLLDLSTLYNFLEKHLMFGFFKIRQKKFINNSGKNCIRNNIRQYKNAFLLSADFFRHLKILVPIYNKFKEKNERAVFVLDSLGSSTALKKIYQIKKDRFNFSSILEIDYIKKQLKINRKKFNLVCKKIYSNRKTASELKLMRSFIEPLLKEGLPLSVLYLKAAEGIIKELKPKGIICHNDARLAEASLLQTAEKHKVKTMIAHSEILSGDKVNSFKCDYFSATGNCVKNELVKLGYPSKKIYVNGDPRLDFLKNRMKTKKLKTYWKIGINRTKKTVLLISDRINPLFSYEEKREQFINVSKAVANLHQIQLIIKPHPTESRDLLIKDTRRWEITNAIITDNAKIELFELLDAVSIVVIAWSMVGFEAMMINVPVIVANFSNKDYNKQIPYVAGGGAIEAKLVIKLSKYLSFFINNTQKRKIQIKKGKSFCSEYYRLPDGNAAKRIVNLISKK